MRRPTRIILIVVIITMSLIFAGCAGSGSPSNMRASTTPTQGLATATAPTTLTPIPPSISPSPVSTNPAALGWIRRGPSYLDQIQEAASAPGALYACGPGSAIPSLHLGFSVSHDGGKTWQSWDTSIPSAICLSLRVSQTASQAVAIYSASCRAECGQSDFYLHYSLDGGKHWTLVSTSETLQGDGSFAWVGTALFSAVAPQGISASATQHLAVSKNGGPFAWTTLPYNTWPLLSTATTLYAPTPEGLYSTANLGATWSKVSPAYQGNAINPTTISPGAPMLGYDARSANGPNIYPLVRSSDGGATWQALPSAPTCSQLNTDAVETPDGAVYITCFGANSGGAGIYKLLPGANQWTLASPLVPGSLFLCTVTWDAGGHPATLWALEQTQSYLNILWAHAP